MNVITEKVSFGCRACESKNLISAGAVLTDDNRIYVVYNCEDCGEAVPIEIDKIIAELYSVPLAPGSSKVN